MHRRAHAIAFNAATLLVLIFTLASPNPAQANPGDTTRISTTTIFSQANAYSEGAIISSDGRYVAFASTADNLVNGDTNGTFDVFVRDLVAGTTERISVASDGSEGDNQSYDPAISADGRYVAFESLATNLAAGDTNASHDVFVHDRLTGVTELISVDSNEVHGNSSSQFPSISADGHYVTFHSYATNLVTNDLGYIDVFVRDRVAGTTERLSVDPGGNNPNGHSSAAVISSDGNFVAFSSSASNLVAGDTNAAYDVFVRDLLADTTTLVSADADCSDLDGCNANGGSFVDSISSDGRYVAFESDATDLTAAEDINGVRDIFLRDLLGGTELISVDTSEDQANAASYAAAISGDGNYVTFYSAATDLVGGDTNGAEDVFLRDRAAGVTTRVSLDSAEAQANGQSNNAAIAGNGDFVAFSSGAPNLVADDTNGATDIFVRDLQLGETERASLGLIEGNSYQPSISSDGRYTAFASSGSYLVSGDTNDFVDVFTHDNQTGAITRLSVDSGGVQGNSESEQPSISSDGGYVAFSSVATNLVSGDTNSLQDIFLRDLDLGTTELISVDTNCGDGDGCNADGVSVTPSISANGNFVAFASFATDLDLVPDGDPNGQMDVFVRDLIGGETERVSLNSSQVAADGFSGRPAISGDGRYVAFESDATDLVIDDTNGVYDVFVRDRQLGDTLRISIDSSGAQADGESHRPAISTDGRYVAFYSDATNLVDGDTNYKDDIFVHDLLTGRTERISVDSDGVEGNDASYDASISSNGRLMAFISYSNNLVLNDANGQSDVFVRDRVAGTTERISVDTGGGDSNGASSDPAISADGNFVSFRSFADNLVSGDINNYGDIFVHESAYAPDLDPVVVSSTRADPDPTSASSVDFSVTFSESVSGVDAGDFSLTTTGVSGASVSGVSGSDDAYTVTVDTGTGNGTLRLNVVDDDSILDITSNPLGGAGAGNGNFTTGQTYTVNKNDAPTDINLSAASVAENQPAGTVVGTFTTTDPDAGDTFTYSLVSGAGSGDNASFTIAGDQLRTGASFNFLAKSSYSIRVRTTDGDGLFFEEAFTISVTDQPNIFSDVPDSYWAVSWIERLYNAGITGGCSSSPLMYCPESNVTRAEMAVFLERGIHGASFSPPNVAPTFTDTAGHWAEDWIEALKSDGITGGCGAGIYCPDASTTRAEMAVFLLRSEHGASYTLPALGGSTGFDDVSLTYWAADWIKQLAAEGITGGCGGGNYCPEDPVTRAQMAVFLVRTFNLP